MKAGSVVSAFSFFYLASTYFETSAESHLGYSRNLILSVGMLSGLAYIGFAALSCYLSDRIGRRRRMLAACGRVWHSRL
ncbi:hypothetical protein A9W99_05240 [Mycobacterium sp. 1164966.3]|nr:hypothetical protein A9W99_05240 [Mycobacterium sp. 1164966.3]